MWARMEVVVDRHAGQSHGGWSHVRSENTDDTRLPGMVVSELVGFNTERHDKASVHCP